MAVSIDWLSKGRYYKSEHTIKIMEKEWGELTPDERRQKRFERWANPEDIEFVSPEAKQNYQVKVTRLIKAISLEEPDRVPTVLHPGYIPVKYAGYTVKDAMYDEEKTIDAWMKFATEVELDCLPSPSMVHCGNAMDLMGNVMYKWAGNGLPDDQSPQYVERDYMEDGEWPGYLSDRSDYHWRTYIPRANTAMAALAKLPPLSTIGPNSPGMEMFTDPEVQAAFKTMAEVSKVNKEWRGMLNQLEKRIKGLGLPPFNILVRGGAPLDNVGAFLRGTRGTITDMFRHPELLHEYMEQAVDEGVQASVQTADMTGIPLMMMPLHRGADGFMNEKQFLEFYWPYLKRVMLGQIEEGLVPCCFAEGGFNTRLEIIKEFPKGKAIWHFDNTDMKKAKDVIGDMACVMGNIPSSLMVTGKPEEVKAYCKQLIEDCAAGGGFVLAPGATTDDAKVENINAMLEAAIEYGQYGS